MEPTSCCPKCKALVGVAYMATDKGPEPMFCTACGWATPELHPEDTAIPAPTSKSSRPATKGAVPSPGRRVRGFRQSEEGRARPAVEPSQKPVKGSEVVDKVAAEVEAGTVALYQKFAAACGMDPDNPVAIEKAKTAGGEVKNAVSLFKRLWDMIPEKD